MRIILIGTNHRHQIIGCPEGETASFENFLRQTISTYAVQALAEELNEEAITLWHGHDSTARKLAQSLGITHLFCDPTIQERTQIGIPTNVQIRTKLGFGSAMTSIEVERLDAELRNHWPARETYWLDRLRSICCNECLFILGSDHVQSFKDLLTAHQIEAYIAHEDWLP